ncbi:hypothetical protein BDR03DRAFT_940593 [Suillus americanus]|nr:hypothetical protein BDR03DRAFT_940593 [Suillus americanus]
MVVYDWVLTFRQERQRWSLMTLLYVGVRYVGILYSVRTSFWFAEAWITVVVNAMLGVIMMVRIHAMYQRSKKVLIFLVVVLLASTITSGIMTVIANIGAVGEEYILSGYRVCMTAIWPNKANLGYESLIPTTIWEILVLCLAVWIVIKHFRELKQSPIGSTIGDCFMALIKSHVFYFLAFVVVTCLTLGALSPNITYASSTGASAYNGIMTFAQALQMFVLGPRLILSIREHNAKIVARSDEGTCMTSINFQAGGDALTTGDV